MDRIKVAIVDDHTVVRQTISRALNMETDILVVGSWDNAESALEFLSVNSADVVLMDYRLPGMDGVEATRRLKVMDETLKVVFLSAYTGDKEVFGAIEAGVTGYVPKEVTLEILVEAIRSVFRGYAYIDPSLTPRVMDRFTFMQKRIDDKRDLSELEKEILTLASRGKANKEIGHLLSIKESSVKAHFREIMRKLSAGDRAHAVAIALRTGRIE